MLQSNQCSDCFLLGVLPGMGFLKLLCDIHYPREILHFSQCPDGFLTGALPGVGFLNCGVAMFIHVKFYNSFNVQMVSLLGSFLRWDFKFGRRNHHLYEVL